MAVTQAVFHMALLHREWWSCCCLHDSPQPRLVAPPAQCDTIRDMAGQATVTDAAVATKSKNSHFLIYTEVLHYYLPYLIFSSTTFPHCILFSWFYLQIMFLLEPSASTIPTQHHASRKEKMGEQVRSNTQLLAFCRLSTTPTKPACANRAHFAPADSTEPPTCRATTFHFTAEQSLETNKLHSASTHPMDEQQGDLAHYTKNSCSGGKAKMRNFQERLHSSPCRRSDNLSHIASNALSCCLV